MIANHPDRERLSSFALGRLRLEDAQEVADHLADCPECESALDAVPDDRVLALIRLVAKRDDVPVPVIPGCESLTFVDRGKGANVRLGARTPLYYADSAPESQSQPPGTDEVVPVPEIPGYENLTFVDNRGLGAVYRAYDPQLKRWVALKVLRRRDDPAHDQRFQAEAQALARLQHPNILQIFEIGQWQPPGQTGPALYVALEYVEGGSLDRVLQRGPLAVREAAQLLEVLARAMQAAHEEGIVHRDLKPGNVLLADPRPGNSGSLNFGLPKIADFGLARLLDADRRQTVAGQMVGTPDYMAPEQADGQLEVGPAADVWALGVILYRCLTGEVPFKSPSLRELLAQICQATPQPLRQLRSEVPAELEAICLRCLEKDPARRYPSAAALADDLARFRSGQPLPPPRPQPHSGPRRRRMLAVGLAALALLGLGMVLSHLAGTRPEQVPAVREPAPARIGQTQPLRVRKLDVLHLKFDGRKTRLHGSFGGVPDGSFGATPEDDIKVTAQLSRPAYCYLIVFRPDGKDEVLYPEDADLVPERTDEPRFPSRDRSQVYGLTDGTGLWLVALVASDKPLPAYDEWRRQHPGGPWRRSEGEANLVWLDDGQWVEAVTPRGVRSRGGRGKKEAAGTAPIVRVVDWLKAQTGGTVSAVGFTVEANK